MFSGVKGRLRFTSPVWLIASQEERKVMACSKSITMSEFFAADKAEGIKPKACLIVRSYDYKGQKLCRYGDVIYAIYRTYDRAEGLTELYLSPKAGLQPSGGGNT